MQLGDYIDLSIETIRLYLVHNVTICTAYKSLISLYLIFTAPLVRWIRNISVPYSSFFNQYVPLIQSYNLVRSIRAIILVCWAYKSVKNWVWNSLLSCTIHIISLLFTNTWWWIRDITAWGLSEIIWIKTLPSTFLYTLTAIIHWKICCLNVLVT